MRTTATLNDRNFRRKVAALRAASGPGGPAPDAALRELAATALKHMIVIAHAEAKDTGSYVRGWEMALNDLRPGSMPLTPLTPSRSTEAIREELEDQVAFWGRERARLAGWVRGMEARRAKVRTPRGGTWRSLELARRELDRVGDVEDRALQILAEFEAAQEEGRVVIAISGRATKRAGVSRLTSLRLDTSGGSARVYTVGDRHLAELRNSAPHARLVESGWRRVVVGGRIINVRSKTRLAPEFAERQRALAFPGRRIGARAIAMARAAGVRRVGRAYLAELHRVAALRRGSDRLAAEAA